MKVLQVLPSLEGGGVERGTLEIARAIVDAGHESWVLSAGGRMVAELEAAGSRHMQWALGKKSPLTLLQVTKVRRWLLEQQFDIVHLRSRMPAWIIWLAWRKLPAAQRPHLISTVHGMHSVSRYSEIVTCGERVIAVSKSIQRYILENYPRTDANKIRLIYRGVDPGAFPRHYQASEQWRQQWFKHYPALKDHFVICLPGRLTRLKNHHALINIVGQLRGAGVPVMGLIVGGEDPKRQGYAREIRERIAEAGLQESIIMTGHRSDIQEIYSVSNLVLSLSSKPESFGRAVLETLSLGVPVIGYDHGGVGEILQALFPQGAVPLNDEQAVADRVRQFVNSGVPAIRENDQFLLADMCAQTLAVYEEVLA